MESEEDEEVELTLDELVERNRHLCIQVEDLTEQLVAYEHHDFFLQQRLEAEKAYTRYLEYQLERMRAGNGGH